MKNGVHYVRKTLNTIPGNLYERPRLTYYKTKKPLRNIDINLSNSSSDENNNLTDLKKNNDNIQKEANLNTYQNVALVNENQNLSNIKAEQEIKLNNNITPYNTKPINKNNVYNNYNNYMTINILNLNSSNYNQDFNRQTYNTSGLNVIKHPQYSNKYFNQPIVLSPLAKKHYQVIPVKKSIKDLSFNKNHMNFFAEENKYQDKYDFNNSLNIKKNMLNIRYKTLPKKRIANETFTYRDNNYQIIDQNNIYSQNSANNYNFNQNLNNDIMPSQNINEINSYINSNNNNLIINSEKKSKEIYNQETLSTPVKQKNNITDIYEQYSANIHSDNNKDKNPPYYINEITTPPTDNQINPKIEYIISPQKNNLESVRLTQTFHNNTYSKEYYQEHKNINNNLFLSPLKPQDKNDINFSERKNPDIDFTPNISRILFNKEISIKSFHCFTHEGKTEDGLPKTNQDSYISLQNVNNIKNFNIFGVLDGHGLHGHLVSEYISEHLPQKILSHPSIKSNRDLESIYLNLKQDDYAIIKQAFISVDNQIRTCSFDVQDSGSTCILIIMMGAQLICANIGDSRGIAVYDEKNDKELNYLKVIPLSLDYKPDLPEERSRILMAGGVVEKYKDSMGVGSGPLRVFAPGKNYPGLAMSRSIGDTVAKKFGVIAEPGIVEYHLTAQDKFIVLCSDGVWEFLTNEEVKNIGRQFYLHSYPEELCEELYSRSLIQWECNDSIVDDITAVAIYF